MKIVLNRGPLDGQTDTNVRDDCEVYRRSGQGPLARYRNSGHVDSNGDQMFEWWPPKANEAEPVQGIVHDA